MKQILVFLLLIALIGCEEEIYSDDCVNGTIVSTSACTGNGVIISIETENRKINNKLDNYGDQREITVFNTNLTGVEIGDKISFRIFKLVDTARACLMAYEGPRGPEARIKFDCE